MKKNLLCILLLFSFAAKSQEILSDINFVRESLRKNNAYKNLQSQSLSSQYPGTFVYFYDTLSLPFQDDFSTDKLKPYDYPQNAIFQVVYKGICKPDSGILYDTLRFMADTSWSYSYDTTTSSVDSAAKSSMFFILYEDTLNCSVPTDTLEIWPLYYTYTFDTVTGLAIDSQLVQADTFLLTGLDSTVYYVANDTTFRWIDNYAFVNNTFPKNPITIGVATLDGLDEFGDAYQDKSFAYGQADFLTSKPLDMSVWKISDSVRFSFFYQPQGNGDYPNLSDSLIAEFRNKNGNWDIIWAKRGPDTIGVDTFTQVVAPVTDSASYFYKGFQFRFRNKATVSGNNDHWHIDYVKLDTSSASVSDIAFIFPASSLLDRYQAMPYEQFKADSAGGLASKLLIYVRNNSNSVVPVKPFYQASEIYSGMFIDSFRLGAALPLSLSPQTDTVIPFDTVIPIPAYLQRDSILIRATFDLGLGPGSNDEIATNDSVVQDYILSNYFAYDDGTAEKAIGVYGSGMKFAYQFKMRKPDTLQAVQFHFVHYNADVSNKEFTLIVWKSIAPGSVAEDTIYTDNQSPRYVDERNGFVTFKLTRPLVLDSGVFYVGYQNTYPDLLNIGFDVNNNSKSYTYYTNYQQGGNWAQSKYDGATMIRPIVGKPLNYKWENVSFPPKATAQKSNPVSAYPNPALDYLKLKNVQPEQRFDLLIYNYMGVLVMQKEWSNNGIDISSLQPGIYLVQLRDKSSGEKSILKFIKL